MIYDRRDTFYVSAIDLSHRDKPLRFFFGDEMETSRVLDHFTTSSDWEVKGHGPAGFVLGDTLVDEMTHKDVWKSGHGWAVLKVWAPNGLRWQVVVGDWTSDVPTFADDYKALANDLRRFEGMTDEDLALEIGHFSSVGVKGKALNRYTSWRLQCPTEKRATPSR